MTNLLQGLEIRGSFIGNQFVKSGDPNGEIPIKNPGDLEQTPQGYPFSYDHISDAVGSAKSAQRVWKKSANSDRLSAITRYQDCLKKNINALSTWISWEIGKPLWESRWEVEETCRLIDYFLKELKDAPSELTVPNASAESSGLVRFRPYGVFAVISPFHQPVLSSHFHWIPAVLFGNTVVLKSSQHAPVTGQIIAECLLKANLPSGVVNVVAGDSESSRRLVSHPEVDGVLYTGSYEVGMKIAKQLVADYWKMVVLDMGGRNASIIWEDAIYEKALYESLFAAFATTGQRCGSTALVFVHDKIFDKFVDDFHQLAKKCRIGFAWDEGENEPFMGPLISEVALERYLRAQGIAIREGCEEIMRGKPLERKKRGYYVSPSLHVVEKLEPKNIYFRTEIFGPNVAFFRLTDIGEAAQIINSTHYGLVTSLYSKERSLFSALLDELKVGCINWNRPTTDLSYRLPYGGLGKSGNMRPMGAYARSACAYPVSSLENTASYTRNGLPETLPSL